MEKLVRKHEKKLAALLQKKYRDRENKFILEGIKPLIDVSARGFKADYIIFDKEDHPVKSKLTKYYNQNEMFYTDSFHKLSALVTSEGVAGIYNKIEEKGKADFFLSNDKILLLYKPSDPGNLGTIIRTAVWFGINGIVLLGDSVDIYNPKVLRSSMGSIFFVDIINIPEDEFDFRLISDFYKIGTYVHKDRSKNIDKNKKTILFLGNESHGLPENFENEMDVNYKIEGGSTESLNLSIAAGICINEIFK